MSKPLWTPSPEHRAASNLAQFMARTGVEPTLDYAEIHEWSVRNPAAFWQAVWEEAGVVGECGDRVLMPAAHMIDARFFPDAHLNFAENLLRRRDAAPAILFRNEVGERPALSWADLYDQVARLAAWMRDRGIGVGDRVAAIMPNMPETVVAMLATASLGAIWSSCSPDFGPRGILDRFGQIAPRLLIAADGYYYNGKPLPIVDKLREISHGLPDVDQIVLVPVLGQGTLKDAVGWQEIQNGPAPAEIAFEQLPFAHPLYIMYSSGTTGVPKCIVHSAGGTLLQHLKEHRLHCDIRPGDRVFYFTTCGWMMWNWLVSALASQATLVLYDGSPFYPDGLTLFRYAEEARIDIFGTSAKFIDALNKAGLEPGQVCNLDSVRLILSTGSPLVDEGFDYVYRAISPTAQLCSISGGTDIISCFVLGNPLSPVWRGEIQGPGLGMAVDVWDEAGNSLPHGKGELVCTAPFPSMPIGFWNDTDRSKYRAAYFERFPGIWCHGDFAEKTEQGGYRIHGRSDATLNPGGVRIGTAEIYAIVESLEPVQEAIAVGQDWEGDVRVILFVVMKPGHALNDELVKTIKSRIRTGASPRHVPAKIIAVADIPRTKSGKITELAVRDIIHGRVVRNREALANPEALDLFAGLADLKT